MGAGDGDTPGLSPGRAAAPPSRRESDWVTLPKGLGALQTGLLWLPQSLWVAIILPFSGRSFERFGPAVCLVPGLSILVVAMLLLSSLSINTSPGGIMEM
jgi:hypothetical protein